MGILGKLFAHGVDGDFVLRTNRKFTRQDLIQIADLGASQFRDSNSNLLSCYDLENEFGLYST